VQNRRGERGWSGVEQRNYDDGDGDDAATPPFLNAEHKRKRGIRLAIKDEGMLKLVSLCEKKKGGRGREDEIENTTTQIPVLR
jgi:hypothetical protein